MSQQRYRIDLSGQHAECEANYARLLRLLAPMEDRAVLQLGLPDDDTLQLTIAETFPYTQTVEVATVGRGRWPMPPLMVRLYHDARMAEVIACGGQRRPRPRYAYPNRKMFQPDEKEQWNRFLGEWLSHGLRHGRVLGGVPAAPPCEL